MKVTVRKRFRDADTLQIMRVGEVAEYEAERAEELARGGFVRIADEDETEKVETPTSDDDDTDTSKGDDTDNPEKVEVDEDETEKVETTHVPKGKLGRKPKK